jgi:hypothetical protein
VLVGDCAGVGTGDLEAVAEVVRLVGGGVVSGIDQAVGLTLGVVGQLRGDIARLGQAE